MKDLLNPWVIAGTILIAALLLIASFFAAGSLTPPRSARIQRGSHHNGDPHPNFYSDCSTDQPLTTPTDESLIGIQVGSYVKILGTDGEGLRLRREPSLAGEIVFLGLEGEIFTVSGGPQERDGYLWWYLEAPLMKPGTAGLCRIFWNQPRVLNKKQKAWPFCFFGWLSLDQLILCEMNKMVAQVMSYCVGSCLCPVADIQFRKNAADVVSDSAFTQIKGFGDFPIGFSFGDMD